MNIRKFIAGLTVFAVSAALFQSYPCISANAADTVVYNAAEFETYKSRTVEEVAKRYSDALYAGETYSGSDESTYYSVPSSLKAPYSYGVLTEDTHKAMTAMTDFYRWLVGADELKVKSEHSESLQAQAFDRNFQFDHVISMDSKPAEMPDEVWLPGFECDHNILAWGYTPQGAVTGWMNEGYSLSSQSWDTVGHRTALISPTLSNIQFGYSGAIAIGADIEYKNEYKEAFSAFPPQGYVPSKLVSASESSWTVALDPDKITSSGENVNVSITNLNTGKVFIRNVGDNTLKSSRSFLNFVQPDDSKVFTDSYKVDITGLTDASGKDAEIIYEVCFFDTTQYSPSYVKSVSAEVSDYVVYKTLGSTENLKKLTAILPNEVKAVSGTGFECMVPVKGPWVLDEKNSCWKNSADASALPKILTDKNNVLDDIKINYTISDDEYDYYNTLNIYPAECNEGDTVKFSVYRTNISSDTSRVFKIIPGSDGTYSGIKMLDSAVSPEFDPEASKDSYYSASHIYEVKNINKDFSGEFVSIYFNSKWPNSAAYVSTAIVKLNVISSNSETGDINGDGTVNVADLTMLKMYLVNKAPDGNLVSSNADINNDGAVDVFDCILLKRILLKK